MKCFYKMDSTDIFYKFISEENYLNLGFILDNFYIENVKYNSLRDYIRKNNIKKSAKLLVHLNGIKFLNAELREKLFLISDDTLIQDDDDLKNNILGKILTVILHILKYGSCDKMNHVLLEHIKIKNLPHFTHKIYKFK